CGGELNVYARTRSSDRLVEQIHDGRREDVDAEQTEVIPRPQAGHNQGLLGQAGGWFFDHVLDLIEVGPAGNAAAAGSTVIRQHVLPRGLDGGDGRVFGDGAFDDLGGAAEGAAAEVQVIADEVQEGAAGGELTGEPQRVAVAQRLRLLDEDESTDVGPRCLSVGGLIAGTDDEGDLVVSRFDGLLKDDGQRLFLAAIAVDERLQGQRPLVPRCGGDDCFAKFHDRSP